MQALLAVAKVDGSRKYVSLTVKLQLLKVSFQCSVLRSGALDLSSADKMYQKFPDTSRPMTVMRSPG